MIAVAAGVKVLVATKPVDFRKGADGLVALVREALGHDPFSETIFIFRSKRADRLKVLAWDGSGLVLFWKRLAVTAADRTAVSPRRRRLAAMSASLRKRPNCCVAAKCREGPTGDVRARVTPPAAPRCGPLGRQRLLRRRRGTRSSFATTIAGQGSTCLECQSRRGGEPARRVHRAPGY